MKTITATEFKAKCLDILDHVPPGGLVVTKRGKPVAKIFPHQGRSISELIGSRPWIIVEGADIFSTGIKWNAES